MAKQPSQSPAAEVGETSGAPATREADNDTNVPTFTADDVAKAIKATIRVQEKGKNDEIGIVERTAGADDILSFRVDGRTVIALTIDGRKHRAEIG